MARAFNDQNQRINLPRSPTASPVPNQGGVAPGLPRPAPAPRGVQTRQRRDEVVRPAINPQTTVPQAPSQTQPVAAPVPPSAQLPPPRPPGPTAPPGSVEMKREFMGPGGEKIQVQAAPGGGLQPETPSPEAAEQTLREQGTSLQGAQTVSAPPPAKTSPLGDQSPVEQFTKATPSLPPGANQHLRSIAITNQSMTPEERMRFEQTAVRSFQQFGRYSGDDDPESPPPPIRPGKHSFNPTTGQWVAPEGQVSVIDKAMKLIGGSL